MDKDKIILEMIGGRSGKLLDVGGGNGILGTKLPKGIEYINLDWSKYATIKCDLNKGKIPFKSRSFDIVICSEVLEHLFNSRAILKEIKRVVKKGGIVIFTMPNEYNLYLRLRYLFGENTAHNKPFQGNGEQHVNLPRVKDILDFIREEFEPVEVRYLFISHKKYFFDPLINALAQVMPTLFCRNVIIRAKG
ncbi:MAG TPA: class I SAM-dependent methyltransferase [Candidatus Norongarragalinales archaeon]|nr:class I SAM-dependent methyltransferase [Candidatus Norongarragalinales archaeon]